MANSNLRQHDDECVYVYVYAYVYVYGGDEISIDLYVRTSCCGTPGMNF